MLLLYVDGCWVYECELFVVMVMEFGLVLVDVFVGL